MHFTNQVARSGVKHFCFKALPHQQYRCYRIVLTAEMVWACLTCQLTMFPSICCMDNSHIIRGAKEDSWNTLRTRYDSTWKPVAFQQLTGQWRTSVEPSAMQDQICFERRAMLKVWNVGVRYTKAELPSHLRAYVRNYEHHMRCLLVAPTVQKSDFVPTKDQARDEGGFDWFDRTPLSRQQYMYTCNCCGPSCKLPNIYVKNTSEFAPKWAISSEKVPKFSGEGSQPPPQNPPQSVPGTAAIKASDRNQPLS